MRAVRIAAAGDLRLVDVPVPEPGPGEILVRVGFAGICFTDIEVLRGNHEAYLSGWGRYPIIPGHEWAGHVAAVGDGVVGFAPGDLVTGETGIGCMQCPLCQSGAYNCCPDVVETGIINRDGAMREYHLHPARFAHRMDGLTSRLGALVEPASVGVYACRRAGVGPGDRVVVCGGGSIGQLCAQAARALGAEQVAVTSRSREKLDLAVRLGADAAINAAQEDARKCARELTSGDLFTVAIEAAGTSAALDDCLALAAPRGRIALVGYADDEPYAHSLAKIIGVELSVIGVRGSPGVWPETIAMVREGRLQLAPLISHEYPLGQYSEAFETASKGGPNVLKVLLNLDAG